MHLTDITLRSYRQYASIENAMLHTQRMHIVQDTLRCSAVHPAGGLRGMLQSFSEDRVRRQSAYKQKGSVPSMQLPQRQRTKRHRRYVTTNVLFSGRTIDLKVNCKGNARQDISGFY